MKRFSEMLIAIAAVCLLLLPIGVQALGERAEAEEAIPAVEAFAEPAAEETTEPLPAATEAPAEEAMTEESSEAEAAPADDPDAAPEAAAAEEPATDGAEEETVSEEEIEVSGDDEQTTEVGTATPTDIVTLDANGGIFASPTDATRTITVSQGEAYIPLDLSVNIPSFIGHLFDGWFTAKSGGDKIESTTIDTIKKDHTLFAHWSWECAAPAISSLENTATGIEVTWGKAAGAAKYRVFCKTGSGGWKTLGDTTGTSLGVTTYDRVNAFESGKAYTFTVRCLTSDGKSFASAYDTTGKSITYIAAPKISTLENTTTGIKVTWGKVAGAAKYRVFCKTGSGGWKTLGDTTGTSLGVTTYDRVNAFVSGKAYTFTVRCLTSDGKSFASAYDATGKSITYIAAPKIGSLENTTTGIKVTWGKVAGAAKYRVFCKTGSGGWKTLGDTTGTSLNVTTYDRVNAFESGKEYTFTVRCLKSDGSWASAYDTTGKMIRYLATPKLTSAAAASGKITVKWGKVTGAEGYIVYRKIPGASWTNLGKVTALSYVDTTAKKGTTYCYTVKAYYGGTKSYHNTVGVTATAK